MWTIYQQLLCIGGKEVIKNDTSREIVVHVLWKFGKNVEKKGV